MANVLELSIIETTHCGLVIKQGSVKLVGKLTLLLTVDHPQLSMVWAGGKLPLPSSPWEERGKSEIYV